MKTVRCLQYLITTMICRSLQCYIIILVYCYIPVLTILICDLGGFANYCSSWMVHECVCVRRGS